MSDPRPRFSAVRIRLFGGPQTTEVRRLFPECWNSLTDEQHCKHRRGYLVHHYDANNVVGVVVVQFHYKPGDTRLWIHRMQVRCDWVADVNEIERVLVDKLQHLANAYKIPLLTLVPSERTDFLRTMGFIAWRFYRGLSVPQFGPPPEQPAQPSNHSEINTTCPPRVADGWSMLWLPPEPDDHQPHFSENTP